MRTRRKVLIGGTALVLGAAAAVSVPFRRDLGRFRERAAPGLSTVIATRHGPLEYAEAGAGAPVLMLHGTGGGFDQGLLATRRLPGLGYRVIAPSRFGYLRTPLPEGAGPDMEADAMADLLDHLGLDRVAVSGGSAGAIPALAFAARYPERVAALVPVVPALMIPGRDSVEPWSPAMRWAVMRALRSDLLFWGAVRLAPDAVTGSVLATDPGLVAAAGPEEQRRVREMMESILPISDRVEGLLYDNAQTNRLQAIDFATISAPTLLVSAEDDRFLTAENARYLAGVIPAAEALILPDGGHVWVGHDAEVFAAIDGFLRRVGAA